MRKLLALLALVPGFAVAMPVTYEFTGFMANVRDDVPHHEVSGFITLNSDALETIVLDDHWGFRSEFENPIISFQFFGYDHFSLSPDTSNGSFDLHKQDFNVSDWTEWWFNVNAFLDDGTRISFSHEQRCDWIACQAPDLSAYLSTYDMLNDPVNYWSRMYLNIRHPDDGYSVIYEMNSFVQVPEPGTLGLLALGLIGVAFARRRSARQNNLSRSE